MASDGKPLDRANARSAFRSQTFYAENGATWVAIDPQRRTTTIDVR